MDVTKPTQYKENLLNGKWQLSSFNCPLSTLIPLRCLAQVNAPGALARYYRDGASYPNRYEIPNGKRCRCIVSDAPSVSTPSDIIQREWTEQIKARGYVAWQRWPGAWD